MEPGRSQALLVQRRRDDAVGPARAASGRWRCRGSRTPPGPRPRSPGPRSRPTGPDWLPTRHGTRSTSASISSTRATGQTRAFEPTSIKRLAQPAGIAHHHRPTERAELRPGPGDDLRADPGHIAQREQQSRSIGHETIQAGGTIAKGKTGNKVFLYFLVPTLCFFSFPRSAWERDFRRRSASMNSAQHRSRRRASTEGAFPRRAWERGREGYFASFTTRRSSTVRGGNWLPPFMPRSASSSQS